MPAIGGQSASAQQPVVHFAGHFFIVPHVKSQRVPSQVGVPPAGAVQASHSPPQWRIELLSTQVPEQLCCVAEHV